MAWTLETLVRSPWLSRQPAPAAKALLAAGRVVMRAAGEAVSGDGDPPGLFALVEGEVGVELTVGRGRAVLVDILQPGAWHCRAADGGGPLIVRARTAATLFVIPNAAMRRADVWRSAADLACRQLHEALALLARQRTASPVALIAHRLLVLAEGDPPTVAINQSVLGELTGMTRKAANGHLAALEGEGAIRRAYGKIVLVDRVRLRAIADIP